ncbi:MAG: hypothetical protein ABEJ98_04355 [Candidatus Nanohaloarchaea archaeon]
MKCEVCGRTEEDLEETFGDDIEVQEHQGINKCSKCIREYEVESGANDDSPSEERAENVDWKEEIMA